MTYWTFEYQDPEGEWKMSLVRVSTAEDAAVLAAKFMANLAVKFGDKSPVRLAQTTDLATFEQLKARFEEAGIPL